MHGRVWTCCEDDWEEDYEGAPAVGWPARQVVGAKSRVGRGGSLGFGAFRCRLSDRLWGMPKIRYADLGFRPARSLR